MHRRFGIHPAANIFPLIEGPSFDALKRDISRHGLLQPIEIWENEIIDGRNRLRACEELGIQARFRQLTPSAGACPIAYVLSANVHRRHLSPSQLAMAGARARVFFDEDARKRRSRKPESVLEKLPPLRGSARDLAGASVGVSGRTIDAATFVLKSGTPELIEACERGSIAVSRAMKLARLPKERQEIALRGGKQGIAEALRPESCDPSPWHALGLLLDRAALQQQLLEAKVRALQDPAEHSPGADLASSCVERLEALGAAFTRLASEVVRAFAEAPQSEMTGAASHSGAPRRGQPLERSVDARVHTARPASDLPTRGLHAPRR